MTGIHLTIFTKATNDTSSTPGLGRHLHVAGVGGSVKAGPGVFFVGVLSSETLRKRVGRKPEPFHITLPDEDYTADKGYDSILPDNPVPLLSDNGDFLNHLMSTFPMDGRFDR